MQNTAAAVAGQIYRRMVEFQQFQPLICRHGVLATAGQDTLAQAVMNYVSTYAGAGMRKWIILMSGVSLMFGCATKITGQVRLVDQNLRPVADGELAGILINIINTTEAVQNASYSVKTDEKGKFSTQDLKLKPGKYKIEVSHVGYRSTSTAEKIGSGNNKLELILKKYPPNKRRSVRVQGSDADKIINPGEVNIQPPSM